MRRALPLIIVTLTLLAACERTPAQRYRRTLDYAAAIARAHRRDEYKRLLDFAAAVERAKHRPAEAPYGVWDRLAQCESTGRWSLASGNGYFGGLQFSLGTFHAYGGHGYPNRNSRTEQIRVAERVRAAAHGTYRDWPGCRRHLGLP